MSRMSDLSVVLSDRDYIVRHLEAGTTVYGIIRSVARSGMSRVIDFYVIADGRPLRITGLMADLGIGTWTHGRDGIRVSGCSVDMIFHSVYCLSAYLEDTGVIATPETAPHSGYALKYERL